MQSLGVMAMAGPRRRPPRGGGAGRNVYQEVTDRIVAMIENGTAPWQRPWDHPRHPNAPTRPVNATTGKFYRGINVLLLHASLLTLDDPRWCGYEQAKARGWQVAAGARGTTIYFFKPLEVDAAHDADGEPLLGEDGLPLKRTIPLLRPSTVFHASQIEGIPSLEEVYGPADGRPDYRWDAEDRLETLLRQSGARIAHAGGIACYRPREDRIVLPPRERFPNAAAYYGVAFHELGHWTGHETRLHRLLVAQRDSPDYAREELRAELASAFLGAELGIQHDLESHAAYLDAYLDLLRQDNREIFRAARDAQEIADLILDRHPTWQLRQGVCVTRTDPVPDQEPAPNNVEDGRLKARTLPETHPLSGSENRTPAGNSGESSAAFAAVEAPFRWAVAAVRALDTADAGAGEDSALGRLARQIDAAFSPVPPSAPPAAAMRRPADWPPRPRAAPAPLH